MCGKKYVNKYTGPDGYRCNCVYIMEKLDVKKEIFLSISLDEDRHTPVIKYTKYGGQHFDRTESINPDDVYRLYIDYTKGCDLKELLAIGNNLGI